MEPLVWAGDPGTAQLGAPAQGLSHGCSWGDCEDCGHLKVQLAKIFPRAHSRASWEDLVSCELLDWGLQFFTSRLLDATSVPCHVDLSKHTHNTASCLVRVGKREEWERGACYAPWLTGFCSSLLSEVGTTRNPTLQMETEPQGE